MKDIPKVSIIVLNYNGNDCLLSCLCSLDQLEYGNKEIVVVDNGSTDNSLFLAQKLFPNLIFICNEKNEGFSKGMNMGMKQSFLRGAAFCLLFNYDAEIDAQALKRLICVAEKNTHVGLLSPIIYNKESKKIWFAKGKIEFLRMRTIHQKVSQEEFMKESYQSEFLTGCALLVKKELVDVIGFLDEKFFLYYEDADYSLRATKAGFQCLVVPSASVYHSEKSTTNPKKTYFLVYSGLLFFEKHIPAILRPYMAIYVTMRRWKNALDRFLKKGIIAEEVGFAYKEFFHGHIS